MRHPIQLANIYVITNTINGKRYVGKTVKTIEKRFNEHMRCGGDAPRLHSAIKKYGRDAFIVRTLCVVSNGPDLNKAEKFFIGHCKTRAWLGESGYNLTPGGDGILGGVHHPRYGIKPEDHPMFGRTHTPEARKRMSESRLGEKNFRYGKGPTKGSFKAGKEHPNYGKPQHPNNKAAIIEANKTRIYTDETRAKMSTALKGRTSPTKGMKFPNRAKVSDEEKQRMKETKTGYYHVRPKMSDEERTRRQQERREARKLETLKRRAERPKRVLSAETRKKMSEAGKGRKFSEEHKKRISDSLKRRYGHGT